MGHPPKHSTAVRPHAELARQVVHLDYLHDDKMANEDSAQHHTQLVDAVVAGTSDSPSAR